MDLIDYQPGGTITVEGVAYEIDAVDISCSTENGRYVVATRVRTRPLPAGTVARMAAALADIADRHQPDLMSSTETLRCDWCSQQAGIPVPWPCMDRGAIGDLLPLPNNRLLPP